MSKANPQPGAPFELELRPESARAPVVVMVFRWIPAGKFIMGQRGGHKHEEPRHWVEITEGFWLAETPVTQAQYRLWKPGHRNRFRGEDCPAERITWYDAVAYCGWLTDQVREEGAMISGCWGATLPTEAQWEYACRGGVGRAEYHGGNGEGALREVGWFDGNSGNQTHPVKGLKPNRWNLYDLHGNVWEWCADEYRGEAYRMREDGEKDPGREDQELLLNGRGPEAPKDRLRLLRGGSWCDTAVWCRAAYRFGRLPVGVLVDDGFRPCLVPVSGGPSRKSSEVRVGAGDGRRSDEGREATSDGAGGDLARFHVRADPHRFVSDDS